MARESNNGGSRLDKVSGNKKIIGTIVSSMLLGALGYYYYNKTNEPSDGVEIIENGKSNDKTTYMLTPDGHVAEMVPDMYGGRQFLDNPNLGGNFREERNLVYRLKRSKYFKMGELDENGNRPVNLKIEEKVDAKGKKYMEIENKKFYKYNDNEPISGYAYSFNEDGSITLYYFIKGGVVASLNIAGNTDEVRVSHVDVWGQKAYTDIYNSRGTDPKVIKDQYSRGEPTSKFNANVDNEE